MKKWRNNVSQGSIEKNVGRVETFNNHFVSNSVGECVNERVLKIGAGATKIWWLTFWTTFYIAVNKTTIADFILVLPARCGCKIFTHYVGIHISVFLLCVSLCEFYFESPCIKALLYHILSTGTLMLHTT